MRLEILRDALKRQKIDAATIQFMCMPLLSTLDLCSLAMVLIAQYHFAVVPFVNVGWCMYG